SPEVPDVGRVTNRERVCRVASKGEDHRQGRERREQQHRDGQRPLALGRVGQIEQLLVDRVVAEGRVEVDGGGLAHGIAREILYAVLGPMQPTTPKSRCSTNFLLPYCGTFTREMASAKLVACPSCGFAKNPPGSV